MTRQEIEQSLNDLNSLVLEGKLLDAFEKYYHDDVAMQVNNFSIFPFLHRYLCIVSIAPLLVRVVVAPNNKGDVITNSR